MIPGPRAFCFFLPDPPTPHSLGASYLRGLAGALRKGGHSVQEIAVPRAADAPGAAWQQLANGALPVIDGQMLAAFAGMENALRAAGAVALLHHLPGGTAIPADLQELLANVARVIVSSQALAATLTEQHVLAAEALHVVAPGFAADPQDLVPRSTGSGGTLCQILSIGAPVLRKGHDRLLHALARLFDLRWHLTIVGTAAQHPAAGATDGLAELQALAATLGIAERLTLAGDVDDKALAALWARTDLFALASRWEAWPLAIGAALRHGVPVATTAAGDAAEYITRSNGILCPPDDLETFSKAMRRAIFDIPLRREMADSAWNAGQALPDWATQAALFVAALA